METVERHKPEAICIPSIPNDLENGLDSDTGLACTPPVSHHLLQNLKIDNYILDHGRLGLSWRTNSTLLSQIVLKSKI
jgi:hypothetical protein